MSQLYQTLLCGDTKSDIRKNDKLKIISEIEKMNPENGEEVFILIYEHYIKCNNSNDILIPYSGIYDEENKLVTFNMSKLPVQLRHILLKFVNIITKQDK